jgi:hypothetical protein
MSLPLTRRIAKTVLLTAAGAASVVGSSAGAASAAELPTTDAVGGLTNLDTADLGKSVDGASRTAGHLAPKSSTSPLKQAAPTIEKTVAEEGRSATPRAMKLAGGTVEEARATLREQAPRANAEVPQGQQPQGPNRNGQQGQSKAPDLSVAGLSL